MQSWAQICLVLGYDTAGSGPVILQKTYAILLLPIEQMIMAAKSVKQQTLGMNTPSPIGTPSTTANVPTLQQRNNSIPDASATNQQALLSQMRQVELVRQNQMNAQKQQQLQQQMQQKHIQQQIQQQQHQQQAQQHQQQIQQQLLQQQNLQLQMQLGQQQIISQSQGVSQLSSLIDGLEQKLEVPEKPLEVDSELMTDSLNLKEPIYSSLNEEKVSNVASADADPEEKADITKLETTQDSGDILDSASQVKTEKEEKDNVKIEDESIYVPKVRRVTTFGGLDFATLGPALQRVKPSKEQYGIIHSF
jgi:multidrug efflux pump subunit AcrA (membrane-fusion protein)